MKVSRAKEYLPFVQALAEGRTIQQRYLGKWLDHEEESITFCGRPEVYRIKPTPTPTLRPWKPEEVPVGSQVRFINQNDNRWLITAYWQCKVYLNGANHTFDIHNPITMLRDYEHSIDHGLTWKPCGMEEEV